MSDSKAPKVTFDGISGGGDSKGGYISGGATVTQPITPSTDVYASGNVGRYQSFNGGGGQTDYGVSVGVRTRF